MKAEEGYYRTLRVALGCALGATLCFASSATRAAANWVRVASEPLTNHFHAYGQVEPVAVLPIRAALSGTIEGLSSVVGQHVHAGDKLAELDGPEIAALLAQQQAAVESAKTNLAGAEQVLEIARRQMASHLSTLQTVAQAESELAKAEGNLRSTEAQRSSSQKLLTLLAPTNGTLVAVQAADGERVSSGETILVIQPDDSLWVKAAYYGTAAAMIHAGMVGEFIPASGAGPIAVKVTSVADSLAPDGGESVGLIAAAPSPPWLNGERGEVLLNGEVRSLVTVPTRALVLDQGKYWVLVRTNQGNVARAVVPGPTRAWKTFLERGLAPGAEVMVENAYLEFHRNISQNYAPPD